MVISEQTIKADIIASLRGFRDKFAQDGFSNLSTQPDYVKQTCASRNLLMPDEISKLIEQIERVAAWKAINIIENVIRTVQFNHPMQTKIETEFLTLFPEETLSSWKREIKYDADVIMIHFSGTGVSIFPRLCSTEDVIYRSGDSAYVYRVPGVGANKNGLGNPDASEPNGKMINRVPREYQGIFDRLTDTRKYKVKTGEGVIYAVLDALEYIKSLLKDQRVGSDVKVVVFGHSRGSISGLILSHAMLQDDKTASLPVYLALNDPVTGGVITDNINASMLNIDIERATQFIPPNVKKALITVPVSEMREKFAPVPISLLFCSEATEFTAIAITGNHNSGMFPWNINLTAMRDSYKNIQGLIARHGLDEDNIGLRECVAEFYSNYVTRWLLLNNLTKSDLNSADADIARIYTLLHLYSKWLLENYDKKLMNPKYAIFQNLDHRDVRVLLSKYVGVFYDKEHEKLFRQFAPSCYGLIFEGLGSTDELKERARTEYNALPLSAQTIIDRYVFYEFNCESFEDFLKVEREAKEDQQSDSDVAPSAVVVISAKFKEMGFDRGFKQSPLIKDVGEILRAGTFDSVKLATLAINYLVFKGSYPQYKQKRPQLTDFFEYALRQINTNSYYTGQPPEPQKRPIDGNFPIWYLWPTYRRSLLEGRQSLEREGFDATCDYAQDFACLK